MGDMDDVRCASGGISNYRDPDYNHITLIGEKERQANGLPICTYIHRYLGTLGA